MYEELEQVAWDLKAAQMEAGVDFPVHLSREAGGMVSYQSEQERHLSDNGQPSNMLYDSQLLLIVGWISNSNTDFSHSLALFF